MMNTKNNLYFSELDGLRGVAIILVMLYHIFPYFPFLKFGWIGVDLFFVLSGFLITNVLLSSVKSHKNLRKFYFRRSLRIFPLYFTTLFLFFIGGTVLFSERDPGSIFHYLTNKQIWFWTFTQNLLFVVEGIPKMPYLTHLWSLAIEEQFYLIWPFFILYVKNKIKWISLFIIGTFLWRCYLFFDNSTSPEMYFFNTTTRIDSLLIGSLLSIYLNMGKSIQTRFLIAFYLLMILFFLFTILLYGNIYLESPLTATIGYSFLGFLFASFIYLLVQQKVPQLSLLLNNHLLIKSGKLSFGLYIFHMPIYLVVITKFKQLILLGVNMNNQILLSIITLLFTYSISIIAYNLIELPFLKLKVKLV